MFSIEKLVFFCVFSLVALLGPSAGKGHKGKQQQKRGGGTFSSSPNIIFLLADDLGWGSGGFSTNPDADMTFVTPTLDEWATSGITFSSHYSQESCTPARAALLTGRFPLTMGMQYGAVEATVSWGLNETETTLAQAGKGLLHELLSGKVEYRSHESRTASY